MSATIRLEFRALQSKHLVAETVNQSNTFSSRSLNNTSDCNTLKEKNRQVNVLVSVFEKIDQLLKIIAVTIITSFRHKMCINTPDSPSH